MKLWLDAQLSPATARWLAQQFNVEAFAIQEDENLAAADDLRVFRAARAANAIVMTKDRDFVDLLKRSGPPPQVIWITCGNTSNRALQEVLLKAFPLAVKLLNKGEPLTEIGG